ncbi:MAG: DUF4845 domain-containing protein [Agarilytica sp.]
MKKRQLGFISISHAAIGFSLAVIILVGIKIVPLYVEQSYVTAAYQFLVDNNPDLANMDKSDIRRSIDRYLTVNALGGVQSKSFIIKRKKGTLYVSSVYEVRVPIVANIEAVVNFKSQLDTSNPDKCCDYLIDVVNEKK